MPTYHQPEDVESELHRLLLTAVPPNEHGNKTILHLAERMEVNRWSITKWIRKEKIPPERVLQLVEIGKIGEKPGRDGEVKSRVKREDFDRFVYKA